MLVPIFEYILQVGNTITGDGDIILCNIPVRALPLSIVDDLVNHVAFYTDWKSDAVLPNSNLN